MYKLSRSALDFIAAHRRHHFDITCELAQIPAFSNHEELRADWVKKYMEGFGARGVHIDEALNVVWPIGVTENNPVVVMMAHTDVVFPDTEPLPLRVEDGWIHCPGVGDDTVNLTTMLVVGKYIAQEKLAPAGDYGVLIVANSGEEGLGNLKGSRKICDDYAGRIAEFYSFDGNFDGFSNGAVGSYRYGVTVTTEGGHSYEDFGNPSAIAFLASMIHDLYAVKIPPFGKTTHNVGGIWGGTSVNTIAQSAGMLYEYRSDDRRGLEEMERLFYALVDAYRAMGAGVEVEVLGVRPCCGEVDEEKMAEMVERVTRLYEKYSGKTRAELRIRPSSTDANIPLSRGIPAVTFGLYNGKGAHTREERVEIASMERGLPMCAEFMLSFFK